MKQAILSIITTALAIVVGLVLYNLVGEWIQDCIRYYPIIGPCS